MISQENKSGLRNPWLLGMIALIIIVLGVNVTFILFSAGQGRSTLVERDYKTKDRKANEELLSELGQRHALAWQTSIKKPTVLIQNTPASYEISITDKDGQPVSGSLDVNAYRAADASQDFTTPFKEVSPGTYQGYITFPLKGYWELRIHTVRGTEEFTVGTDRFMVDAQVGNAG